MDKLTHILLVKSDCIKSVKAAEAWAKENTQTRFDTAMKIDGRLRDIEQKMIFELDNEGSGSYYSLSALLKTELADLPDSQRTVAELKSRHPRLGTSGTHSPCTPELGVT